MDIYITFYFMRLSFILAFFGHMCDKMRQMKCSFCYTNIFFRLAGKLIDNKQSFLAAPIERLNRYFFKPTWMCFSLNDL